MDLAAPGGGHTIKRRPQTRPAGLAIPWTASSFRAEEAFRERASTGHGQFLAGCLARKTGLF